MPRQQKLKVFRTPIGFHDAYVAAPSRKAALAAWGSDADLFARGIAEQVTDEALMREPLAHPGTVVRRSRGSAADQFAALPPDQKSKRTAENKPAPNKKPQPGEARKQPPRPSRAALDAAEQQLADLVKRQTVEENDLQQRERDLARERRDLDRDHQRDRKEMQQRVDSAREAHSDALSHWIENR